MPRHHRPPCAAKCRRRRFPSLPLLAFAFAVLGVSGGCSQPAPHSAAATKHADDHEHAHDDGDHGDHDHHDNDHADDHGHEHPTTFAEAVDAIGSRLASLEKAFTDDDHDEADAIVHEIGHLLEDGEELLAKVPAGVAAKAREAWNELGDCLDDVDERLHAADDDRNGVKTAYEAVKDRVGSAIKALRVQANSDGVPGGG